MGYIYKIENNVNHKLYIGKTLFTIERRWNQHKYNAYRDNLKHIPLYSAIQKYGVNNFSVSELEKVDNPQVLSEREKYWIEYYDTYNCGYNASRGGDGLLLYDYDYIWDLWEKGFTIKQISNSVGCLDQVVCTVLNNNGVSTQERIDRSYVNQIASHEPFKRKVNKMDVNTGDILETFPSVSDAAKFIGIDSSTLSKVCKKSGIVNGYKWQYVDCDYVKKDFSPKEVCQIDLQSNEIIAIFPSISEAAKSVDGDSSYISKVCRGIQKSSKGYGWKYR